MTNKNALKYLGLAIVLATLIGCGSDMKSTTSAAGTKLSSSEKTDMGELSWEKTTNDQGHLEMSYDLKIPFGRVYGTLSNTLNFLLPLLQKEEVQNYLSLEMPMGRIIDQNWKEIFVYDVERYEGIHSGYTLTVNAFQVPLWLSRQTRQGAYFEESLNTKARLQKLSSKKWGDDISLKWTPLNRSAKLEMCMNIPGGTLTVPQREIFARARKKTWYGHFSVSSDFDVQLGRLNWDYGRGCFMAYHLHVPQGQDLLQISATRAPYLSNVQYGGLKIRIENWFLRLIDNIMALFNASLRKSLIKNITNSVNTIADQDIESGQWFAKMYSDQVLNDYGRRLQTSLHKSTRRLGAFRNSEDLRRVIKDNCRLLKFSRSDLWTEKHHRFCTELADSVQITIDPLAVDAESRDKGCYSYFANIHESKNQWWSSQCHFNIRFSIQVSNNVKEYLDEVHDLLKLQISKLRIPSEWKEVLEENRVDEYVLSLVLEEAERRGIDEVDVALLRAQLPVWVDAVKARL